MQCFVSFKKKKYFTAVKKLFPRAHIELKSQQSTMKQASDYCKKDGNFHEKGTLPLDGNVAGGKGTKRKWDEIKSFATSGQLDQIDAEIFVLHYRNLKQISYDYGNDRFVNLPDVCGEWIYGPPGVGKSHIARAENPDLYVKMINKWWDNYDGQKTVLLGKPLTTCCNVLTF